MNSRQRRAALHAARKAGIEFSQAVQPQSRQQGSPSARVQPQKLCRKLWQQAAKLVSPVITIAGLLGLLVTLWPRVSIEPYASTDPSRPFSQQFYVQNNSVYAIKAVTPMCGLPENSGFNIRNLSIALHNEAIEELAPGAKTTLTCSIAGILPAHEMNIDPWVKYKIPLGIRRCFAVSFKGKPVAGGTYIWTYHGSSKCDSN